MIEVDLDKVLTAVLYHLKVLAAVRCMCKDHGLPVEWCLEWEQEVAKSAKVLQDVMEAQGPILRVG